MALIEPAVPAFEFLSSAALNGFDDNVFTDQGARLPVDDVFTSTRGSIKLVAGRDGLIRQVPASRIARGSRGVLVEGASTNISTVSQQVPASSLSNATLAASSVPGPAFPTDLYPNQNAFYNLITSTATNGNYRRSTAVANDSLTRTFSIFVRKSVVSQEVRLIVQLQGGSTPVTDSFVDVNILTGAIGLISSAAILAGIEDYGSCWRIGINITNNTTGHTNTQLLFVPVNGGIGSALIGGLQVEVGPMMTSYIQTTAGTVTRAADTALTKPLGYELNTLEGTVRILAEVPNINLARTLIQLDDGTVNNRITISRTALGTMLFEVVSAGTTVATRNLGLAPATFNGRNFEVSWRQNGNGLTFKFVNGGIEMEETAVTAFPVGLATVRFGHNLAGADQWGAYIKDVAIFDRANTFLNNFADSFNRANTTPPNLGTAPNNVVWTLNGGAIGPLPLPAATTGNITSREYVSPPQSIVYASQNFGQTVTRISSLMQWDLTTGATNGFVTAAMAICVGPLLIDKMVHITIDNSFIKVQKWLDGAQLDWIRIPNVINAQPRFVEVTVLGTTITLNVDGVYYSATDPELPQYVGPFAFWEHFSQNPSLFPLKYLSVACSP